MKKYLTLFAIAIVALGSFTASAQNEFQATTDKNGFYKVLDCPTSPSYFKATAERNEDEGVFNVNIYHGRILAQTIKCDVTSGDMHFLDANFDGNLDIVVGPATARNYSTILLWSDKAKQFVPTGVEINGYLLVNPKSKIWVGMSSDGATSTIYQIYNWDGDKFVVTESLIDFSDPNEYATYGVETKYTLYEGSLDLYNSPEGVGRKCIRTNNIKKLPKDWQRIIDSFEKM